MNGLCVDLVYLCEHNLQKDIRTFNDIYHIRVTFEIVPASNRVNLHIDSGAVSGVESSSSVGGSSCRSSTPPLFSERVQEYIYYKI